MQRLTLNTKFLNARFNPLWVLLLLCGISIAQGIRYTRDYGGTDLRTRVVGARLLAAGKSPYFYKWEPGEPEQWIVTPHHPRRPAEVNGVSVAPGLLYLHMPMNGLRYGAIRWLWTVIQYVLLALIFWCLLARSDLDPVRRTRALALGFLFFGCSALFLLNVERGQSYLVLAAGLAGLLYFARQRQAAAQFGAGVLLALLVFFRPTMLVFALPFLLAARWNFLAGLACAGVPLALHMLVSPLWQEYGRAMKIYGGLQRSALVFTPDWEFPAYVEGRPAPWIMRAARDFRIGGLPSLFFKYSYWLRPLPRGSFVFVFAAMASSVVLLLRKRIQAGRAEDLVLTGFLLYIFLEVLIPAPRGSYNMILWIIPSLLLLANGRGGLVTQAFLLAGLCLVIGFPLATPTLHSIGEILLLIALFHHLNSAPKAIATLSNDKPQTTNDKLP
ncbi:MAG: DUF2029 domain-containing protein [Chitinophagaceae bacterium]|nr:MAG: DUF2029 domain-containing protein [Chitinophagaceae bacterium]